MKSDSPAVGLKEKRTGYELQMLKESCLKTGLELRWVNSDAQLADAMTKVAGIAEEKLARFFRMGSCWRITYDPEMLSAKRRKQLGVDDPLENADDHDVDDNVPHALREHFEKSL